MTRAILLAALLAVPVALSPDAALAQNERVRVTAAPETAPEPETRDETLKRAAALGRRAYDLSEAGYNAAALPLLEQSLTLLRSILGEEDRLTLLATDNYAYMLHQAGRAEEAEALFATTLRIRRAKLGERDPETLTGLNYHAMALIDAGRAAAAEPVLAEALRLRRAVLGANHPETLASLIAYARVLETLGRRPEAAPLLAEALEIRRELLGESHPDTLTSLNNYAFALQELGRLNEAEPLFAKALQLRRQTLGESAPDTLNSLNNYAMVLESLGRAAEAEPLLAEALRLRRAALGARSPDTLTSLNNYALVQIRLGRADVAEPLYAEALEGFRKVLGERHPQTLVALNNYAFVVSKLGRADEAEALYAEALRLHREVLGERHPQTLNSLNNYAFALQMQGRFDVAEPLYAEALRLHRAVLGERHPRTLNILSNYANVLANLGRTAEAEPLMAEALRLRRALLGPDHPDTLISLNGYAAMLDTLDRLDEAEPLYAEAMRLRTAALGAEHPDTLTSMNNYAYVLRRLGRLEEAAALHDKALRLKRKVLGDRHPDTLIGLEGYAMLLARLGRTDEALPLARELAVSTRARAAALARDGLRGSEQQGRELANRQGVERLLADVLWASFAPDRSDRSRAALPGEAFTALQLASAGRTTQAVADAAAARFAADQGLSEMVRERRALAREWPEVEAALVTAEAMGEASAPQREGLRQRLAAIDARLAEIDAVLARETPQFFAIQNQQSVTFDALRERLGPDEAVLFLVPTPDGTHSMAVTRETIRWARADLGEAAANRAVGEMRKGLEIEGGGELPEFSLVQAHALYRQLVAPVEDALAGKARVYVVADGAWSRLPLGTLVTQPPAPGADPNDPAVLRAAGWLADRYALVQLPSLQALVYVRAFGRPADETEDAGFLGFGAPALKGSAALRGARSATLAPRDAAGLAGSGRNSGGGALMDPDALRRLSALPGTRIELQRVSAALGSGADALRLDAAMTERAIRSTDLSGVRVLHLATHAFTSEEAGSLTEPGLVFTPPAQASVADDGYLAASEVVSLALTSARWVILSACNTASPSGKPGESGLSGLAQAFFYAGAESLLVSHWPVFDDIAPVITVEALKASAAGMPRAEALQAAQAKVRDDPALDAAHPAVWAPFSLVGEGR